MPSNSLPVTPTIPVGLEINKKKPILAAAGNTWQHLRSNSVQDGANGNYGPDDIHFVDYNFHNFKKVVSSALLDVALFIANVSQLKTVYLAGSGQPFYAAMITLLSISIILQVFSGLLLICLGRININDPSPAIHREANIVTNCIVVCVFFLTLVNVAVSSLGINAVVYTNSSK